MASTRAMTPDQIRGELRSRRVTQHDLARRMGVSQPWVSLVLRGDIVPSPEVKARMESAIAELLRSAPVETPAVVFEIPTPEGES